MARRPARLKFIIHNADVLMDRFFRVVGAVFRRNGDDRFGTLGLINRLWRMVTSRTGPDSNQEFASSAIIRMADMAVLMKVLPSITTGRRVLTKNRGTNPGSHGSGGFRPMAST